MKHPNQYVIEKPEKQHTPALAAFIATLNGQSQHHIGYCSHQTEEVLEILSGDFGENPALDYFMVAWEGDSLLGVMGYEPDFETGLAEIWGPFVPTGDPNLAVSLYAAMLEQLPSEIKRLGFFMNHVNMVGMGLCAHVGAVVKSNQCLFTCDREDYKSLLEAPEETLTLTLPLLSQIETIHDQLFKDTYISGKSLIEGHDQNHVSFVELEGDRVVGYIYCEAEAPYGTGQIEFLGVDPGVRNRGVGSRLLDRGLQWLFNGPNHTSINRVRLCVNVENTCATRLYEGMGFKLAQQMVYAEYKMP